MGERKVYILLSDTGTIFTRLIKLYTRQDYNHASISFDRTLTEVYSFGRKDPHNPFIGGFVKENTKNSLLRNATCQIYSCSVTEEQFQKMKQFIDEIESLSHLFRYNFLGLFAIVLNKQLNRDYAYFCSEFVATVLSKGSLVKFQKPLSFVSPHDLRQLNNFELEYQGRLADLYGQELVKRSYFQGSHSNILI